MTAYSCICWLFHRIYYDARNHKHKNSLSSWLPVAMAAPTPVSAVVHSSTLVNAGVYLLTRFRPCFNYWLNVILLLVSGLTIFIAGLGVNFEFDLKRIIALSTLRQLGLIITNISIGLSSLAFFHLLTHALFKALLFMCAGGCYSFYRGFTGYSFYGWFIYLYTFYFFEFNGF